jgi:hypothetical protein
LHLVKKRNALLLGSILLLEYINSPWYSQFFIRQIDKELILVRGDGTAWFVLIDVFSFAEEESITTRMAKMMPKIPRAFAIAFIKMVKYSLGFV